jgi:hypothetical protein
MLVSLVLATALAAAPDVRSTAAPEAPTPWLAWAGLSSGVRTETAAPTGEGWIAISRSIAPHFRPELDLGLGYADGPQQVLGSMRLGMNFEFTRGPATPFLWAAFAHNHEADVAAVKRDPVMVMLGLSMDGMQHRTGAEAGGGVRLALGGGADIGVRVGALALLGDGPALTVNGLAFLGYAF